MVKIVVVEDELRIREGLARLITKINPEYEIVGEAEDGLAGIRTVTECRPDLVITDARMPDLGGLEMLERLAASSIKVKAIVLSAYSDFSSACQAIKLGVSEYLLKPVNVGDLTKSLKKIDDQIAVEEQLPRQKAGRSLESVLYSVVLGGVAVDAELRSSLARECTVDTEGQFALATIYLGSRYKSDGKRVLNLAEHTLAKATGFHCRALELPRTNRLLFILFNIDNAASTRGWFDASFMPRMKESGLGELCVGWACFRDLGNLKNVMQQVDASLDWSIVLGNGLMHVWPDIDRTPVAPLSFPFMIESQVRSALCAFDRGRYKSGIEEFLAYLHAENIYSPREVKNAFIRFFWSVLNTAREIEYEKYAALAQQDVLERITFAVTWPELESAGKILLELLPPEESAAPGEDTNVRRAKNVVREFYSQGISLGEVALKLNVTPEYLSAQFHRVAGMTFSSYIRNFRVQKAKELLIGTNLKLYSIGEQVGYRDSKYFCRVFKEATGQKPSDYRKANR